MAGFRTFLKSGHAPTLFAAFFYFAFSCCIWVLNGAMAPFISETYELSPAQKGLMLSVPIFAGALMRFPLGVLAQYIGRKNADAGRDGADRRSPCCSAISSSAPTTMSGHGRAARHRRRQLRRGAVAGLGMVSAALQGLAMGLAGAGNVGHRAGGAGRAAAGQRLWLAEPSTASRRSCMLLPMVRDDRCSRKEPPDVDSIQTFREHIACLFEKDGWAFSLIYVITFGGFIGLATFPADLLLRPVRGEQGAGRPAHHAGGLWAPPCASSAAGSRTAGAASTRLTGVLVIVAVTLVLCGLAGNSLAVTTLLFMLCFAALGAGNGALFQLVPLRWPLATAVAGSMIGEIGAWAAAWCPMRWACRSSTLGTYFWGFLVFAVLAVLMLAMLRVMQIRWTRTWAEKGGRARRPPIRTAGSRRAACQKRPQVGQEQQPVDQQRIEQHADAPARSSTGPPGSR